MLDTETDSIRQSTFDAKFKLYELGRRLRSAPVESGPVEVNRRIESLRSQLVESEEKIRKLKAQNGMGADGPILSLGQIQNEYRKSADQFQNLVRGDMDSSAVPAVLRKSGLPLGVRQSLNELTQKKVKPTAEPIIEEPRAKEAVLRQSFEKTTEAVVRDNNELQRKLKDISNSSSASLGFSDSGIDAYGEASDLKARLSIIEGERDLLKEQVHQAEIQSAELEAKLRSAERERDAFASRVERLNAATVTAPSLNENFTPEQLAHIWMYKAERAREQQWDLQFIDSYRAVLLETYQQAGTNRLQLLSQLGLIKILDESVLEDSQHLYIPSSAPARSLRFQTVTLAILSCIRLRNRLEAARLRKQQLKVALATTTI